MILSLSFRSRWATASEPAVLRVRRADPEADLALVVDLAVDFVELFEREPADREAVDREPADRELAEREPAERELADRLPPERPELLAREPEDPPALLAREPDEPPELLDRELPVLRRLAPPLEPEPDLPLLACGICPSYRRSL
jgi:hypothetical protein